MNSIINDKIKEDDISICKAILSSYLILTIQYCILVILGIIDTRLGSIIQVFSKLLVAGIYIKVLPIVLKRNRKAFIIIYFLAIFIFLFNYIIFSKNQFYIKDLIFPFFFMCLPTFIYTISIVDLKNLKNQTKKVSKIVFILGLILMLLILAQRVKVDSYSMSISYYMLLPTIVYINEVFNKFSIRILLIIIICIFIILSLGSRGAILCTIVFICIKLFYNIKKFNSATISILFILLIVGINMNNILSIINNILIKIGINSRSVFLFLNSDYRLSGRENIYYDVIRLIKENSILGIGIAGDRSNLGVYSHNIILEFLCNYGVILGGLFIVSIFILVIYGLNRKDKVISETIMIWTSLGFIHLMVSNSYWTDIRFWIFLGVVFKCLNIKYKF